MLNKNDNIITYNYYLITCNILCYVILCLFLLFCYNMLYYQLYLNYKLNQKLTSYELKLYNITNFNTINLLSSLFLFAVFYDGITTM